MYSSAYTKATEFTPTGRWRLIYKPEYKEPKMRIEGLIDKSNYPFSKQIVWADEEQISFHYPEKTFYFGEDKSIPETELKRNAYKAITKSNPIDMLGYPIIKGKEDD